MSDETVLDRYPNMPEWAKEKVREFETKLPTMSNSDLVSASRQAVLAAAVMARFRSNSGLDDAKADACYEEAKRRGNPGLYQRGFNSAAALRIAAERAAQRAAEGELESELEAEARRLNPDAPGGTTKETD